MQINISEQDQTPIYLQIVNQVKLQVSSGRLGADEELPSIRALAERLMINPNTVARAYRELEVAGIVTKRRSTGSYISRDASAMNKHDRLQLLFEKVDSLLVDAKQLNVGVREIVELIYEREELMGREVTA